MQRVLNGSKSFFRAEPFPTDTLAQQKWLNAQGYVGEWKYKRTVTHVSNDTNYTNYTNFLINQEL